MSKREKSCLQGYRQIKTERKNNKKYARDNAQPSAYFFCTFILINVYFRMTNL